MPAVAEISDVVVILSHCGYGVWQHTSGKAATVRDVGEGDFAIAGLAGKLTDKPVVVVGGHTHTRLNEEKIEENNLIDGVLITQAEAHGKYLGDITMSIAAENGRKDWYSSVSLHRIKPRDKRVAVDDPKYQTLQNEDDYDADFEKQHIAPLIKALDSKLAEVIGSVDTTDLSRDKMIASRYIGENKLANYMNDAVLARSESFAGGEVDFALFNATGISTGVEKGPLSFKNWYDVMPYADAIHIASLSGQQIFDMLQSNAKRLLRNEEVAGTNLEGFVSRGFLHFSSGIRYEIDPGASARDATAVNITLKGEPIEKRLDKTYTMVVNTYLALGGFGENWNGKPIGGGVAGDIPSFDMRKLQYDHTGLIYRNEVIAHIRESQVISAETGAKLDGRITVLS